MSGFELLCGTEQVKKEPWKPFDEKVCTFLDDWSAALRKDSEAKKYPDVMTFAFWIRRGNIVKRKEDYEKGASSVRIGRGIAFHVAPSNVPVNCMYTYVFGLLAGNANIVRVPSKKFPQVEVLLRVLGETLQKEANYGIWQRTMIVRYDRGSEATEQFSKICSVRVIWGGDDTIRSIRQISLPSRSKEITFADRYSFGVMSAKAVADISEEDMVRLAEDFYNDTYLMDQNACSTPHLLLWQEEGMSGEACERAKKRFWNAVAEVARKYDFADIKSSEKYADLCECVAMVAEIVAVNQYEENLLYVCDLRELPADAVEVIRGKYGLFYQCRNKGNETLLSLNDEKVQTCAYYGVDAVELRQWIVKNHMLGIDRIVPFGKTLDIDLVWDGYDLIQEMSRRIEV